MLKFDNTIKYGLLHCHTEDSIHDSALSVKKLCNRAKELGAPAVALTDHGTLTGIELFRKAAKDAGIKPILGCEAYYAGKHHKSHLILIAKNYTGYQAIMKAVSKANHNIDGKGAPLIDWETLIEFFGKGSIGYGNVIATSACAGGVLATVLLQNMFADEAIEKLIQKNSLLPNPSDANFMMLADEIEQDTKNLEKMETEYKQLQEISKKTYALRERNAKKLPEGEIEAVLAKIEAEKAETEKAKVELLTLRTVKNNFSKKLTVKKQEHKALAEKHSKYYANLEEIERLSQNKKSPDEIWEEALNELNFFKEIFGENFYIELQNHRIPMEIEVYPLLAKMAKETNTPVVIANDIHIATNSPEDIRARQVMRSLRYNKFEPLNIGDEELYIKTDAELVDIISEIIDRDIVEEGLINIGKIVDQCNVEYPTKSNYPVYRDPDGKSSKECLEALARKGISWRFSEGKWNEIYEERLMYELGIIDKLGFNDYLLIVEDFLRYGRLLGQLDKLPETAPTMEELEAMPKDFPTGVGVGPGRGSAVGSLVCYLTGITSQDPLKYNLIFERFLNVERVTMPDIDSDFRPDIRELVVRYCENKYGQNAVCGIMNRSTQQTKAAIRNCARIYGSEIKNDKGAFLGLADAMCKSLPKELKSEDFETAKELLVAEFGTDEVAMKILSDAELVFGTITGIGKHAAGVVISGCPDITDYIPTLYVAGKDSFATQFDKDFVEGLQCLKMDFLGLNNLQIIDDTLRMVRDNYGDTFDIEKLPFEKNVFEKICASGNTTAVFQFESGGMKKMLQEFKPDCFEDLILLVAAYRPGPIQYLPAIIAVKQGKAKPQYIIPEMGEILDATYGKPIYQEQIQQIFNKFAGFTLGEADIIRRLMSKKKVKEFLKYKDKFIEGICDKGALKSDAEAFWDELVKFSEYAFNKSHATAYAYVAYITAYLKQHYTAEYLCSVMNNTDFEKLTSVLGDCKKFNIKTLAPDINTSENRFSVSGPNIICGFETIKGVASVGTIIKNERVKNGEFASFADFLLRTRAKKDAVENLIYAGAFDNFTNNRQGLVNSLPTFNAILDKIKDREKKLNTIQEELNDTSLIKLRLEKAEEEKRRRGSKTKTITDAVIVSEIEKLKERFIAYTKSKEEYVEKLQKVVFDNSEENKAKRLAKEKEVLGSYISTSPLDGYSSTKEAGCISIADLNEDKNLKIMGFISDLKTTKTKKTGEEMAFFKLEDYTGVISVNVFPKAYERNKQFIREGAVVRLSGTCVEEEFNEEIQTKFNVDKIEELKPIRKPITLFVRHLGEWTDEVYPRLKPYLTTNDGYPLILYCQTTGMFRQCEKLYVLKEILDDENFHTEL